MSAVFKTVPLPLRYRAMNQADLNAVLLIEKRTYAFPWSATLFKDCIRVGYRCRLLEIQGRIEAYGVMAVAAGEAHILNLCVRPESQGRGLARRMLEHLLELAYSGAVATVFLEVRFSNTSALRLYQTAGFCEVGLRRGYYPAIGGREDALVMAKEL